MVINSAGRLLNSRHGIPFPHIRDYLTTPAFRNQYTLLDLKTTKRRPIEQLPKQEGKHKEPGIENQYYQRRKAEDPGSIQAKVRKKVEKGRQDPEARIAHVRASAR